MILLGNGLPVRAIFFHNLMTVTANRFQVSKPNDVKKPDARSKKKSPARG